MERGENDVFAHAGDHRRYLRDLCDLGADLWGAGVRYHKLVRDKIPEIIEKQGKTCVTEVLSQDAYIQMVDEKLNEELAEYQESKSLEELADLLEVMEAAVIARGYTWEELLQARDEKRQKRGTFQNRILLKEVIES